jgi:hypothetical protein
MQMKDNLPRTRAAIGQNAEGILDPNLLRYLGYHSPYMPKQLFILRRNGGGTLNVLFGDNQQMDVGFWRNIVKSQNLLVFVDFL